MPQRFEQAVRALPQRLRAAALALPETVRAQAEEIRLRAGQTLTVGAAREYAAGVTVMAEELTRTLENVSQGSLHTVLESLRHGFVTLPGGHRLGVCGSAAVKDGSVAHIRDISSLCVRIAREKKGIAGKLLPALLSFGKLPNTLILSPPGAGKTTLLRDLVRVISDGTLPVPDGGEHQAARPVAIAPMRVSVADERGELAACYGG
ncbi:MAG: stage III sporulation protein AB, partial [Oscillospiraceae bacterium]|nr:stage III sporulation protein AB [Oscillospiraceae bacterium]